ncbi:MAG: hypothetical protein LBC88_01130 [Spirochaetaceae bacterium]|jgi:hypothetical protein|nr:hypothetical protein [Spirochaetaceae bacterium]
MSIKHRTIGKGVLAALKLTGMAAMALSFIMMTVLAGCDNGAGPGPGEENEFTITSAAEWNAAIAAIEAAGGGTFSAPKEYLMTITGTISLPGRDIRYAHDATIQASYISITLKGAGTLSLSSEGSLFTVGDLSQYSNIYDQTLIIDGPTLRGIDENAYALVCVYDGALELRSGTITGNTNEGYGGGVYMGEDAGSFTMSGGTISGNEAGQHGGGVCMERDAGSFTMSGGTISGNETGECGGGVYITVDFDKTGGTIYGSDASEADNKNTASDTDGHAVYYVKSNYYYRDLTLDDSDDISTSTLPETGTGNNWTKKES